MLYVREEKQKGISSGTRVNFGVTITHTLPCVSWSPLELDWGHVTNSNQRTVSMNDVCHFQALELKNPCASSIFLFHAQQPDAIITEWKRDDLQQTLHEGKTNLPCLSHCNVAYSNG